MIAPEKQIKTDSEKELIIPSTNSSIPTEDNKEITQSSDQLKGEEDGIDEKKNNEENGEKDDDIDNIEKSESNNDYIEKENIVKEEIEQENKNNENNEKENINISGENQSEDSKIEKLIKNNKLYTEEKFN